MYSIWQLVGAIYEKNAVGVYYHVKRTTSGLGCVQRKKWTLPIVHPLQPQITVVVDTIEGTSKMVVAATRWAAGGRAWGRC